MLMSGIMTTKQYGSEFQCLLYLLTGKKDVSCCCFNVSGYYMNESFHLAWIWMEEDDCSNILNLKLHYPLAC
jgi:hypothetical protein